MMVINSTISASSAAKILEVIRNRNEHETIPCDSRDAWFQAMNTVRKRLMEVYAFLDCWGKLVPLTGCTPIRVMEWIIETKPRYDFYKHRDILYTTEWNTNISLEGAVIDDREVTYMVFTSKK